MACCQDLMPTFAMILVQIILAAVTICYKLAINDGMPLPVLIAYRYMFGAAFIVPIAFFAERGKRPNLTWKTTTYGFLCGLFGGSLGQNLYLKSLALTSASFAAAMINLVPAMTFIIAVCLRLEKLGWNLSAGKAKVLGTLVGIGGAMLLTFFKGTELNLWNSDLNLLEITMTHHHGPTPAHQSGHNFALGAVLSVASCVSFSLWLIIQAKAMNDYPCPYSITAMMTVWASIQSVVFGVCIEKHWSNWIMGLDIRLITTASGGIVGSGVMFTLMAWCVRQRGPLFVSVFNPLVLVMVAIAGSLFLEEKLHVGMLLGAILIVGGLYVVLRGKGKELKNMSQLMPECEQVHTEQEVHIDMLPPPPPPALQNASSRGDGRGRKSTMEEERESNGRKSTTEGGRESSSEVLYGHGLYIYH